ncbi:MAG: Tfp pilus assembly protein PilV, partial [Pseudohongiellaceae bacterium]
MLANKSVTSKMTTLNRVSTLQKASAGVGLIEVLISILVLSVGLLG